MKRLSMVLMVAALILSSVVSAEGVSEGVFVGVSHGNTSMGHVKKAVIGYNFNENISVEQAYNVFDGFGDYNVTALTHEVVASLEIQNTLRPFIKVGVINVIVDRQWSGAELVAGVGVTISMGQFDVTLEHQESEDFGWNTIGVKYRF